MNELMPMERIENRIYLIRGQKVMLDRDLAELYGVSTKALNQAVKRNSQRFPEDFMFSLTRQEIIRMSQFVTSSKKADLDAKIKYSKSVNALTENGVAMLSSVLRSERAILVNLQIMRTFTKLRQILSSHQELAKKLEQLESQYAKHEVEITTVFKVLKKLMEQPEVEEGSKKRIGFLVEEGE
jgi:hypothetical protein